MADVGPDATSRSIALRRVGIGLVVALAALPLLLGAAASLLGDGPAPHLQTAEEADVVARVESLGRRAVVVREDPPLELDVVTLRVLEQRPLVAGTPTPPPALPVTVEAAVYEQASWWEDGVEDGELVVFLAESGSRWGPPWTLLFALDAGTGRITGEFDDDWSREALGRIVTEAGARTPEERIDAVLERLGGAASDRAGAWTVPELATFHVGQAVEGDVVADRPVPFDLDRWRATPPDERLLPVGPDDPALEVLQPALDLRSVAVAVRPNETFDVPVTDVALEFVGVGVLGWIPLRPGEPTGLVGAAPVGEGVRVRVLGRATEDEVVVLRRFDGDAGTGGSSSVAALSQQMASDGPWALVIDLVVTADEGDGVSLRQTTIHELGLLMERSGR